MALFIGTVWTGIARLGRLWLASILLLSATVQAQELRFQEVLHAAFQGHPELASAKLQLKMRGVDAQQVEAMLDTHMQASMGLSDEVSPVTSPFAPHGTNLSFVSAQVVKPLADGSSLTGMVNYSRVALAYPSSVSSAFQSAINPTYQHQIDLIYRYPLWKGADYPSYQSQKKAAANEIKAAGFRVAMRKEQLTSQAIALFFQLSFSDLSLKLADDAVIRAKQLLGYQKKREIFGLIEKADRLQAEALLATRQLQTVQALAAQDAGQTALNRLMFQSGDTHLEPKVIALPAMNMRVEDMLERARGQRPVFAMLEAQYAAAEARLSQVKDSAEQQLDLVGQVGTRALDGNAGTAFGQGFTLDDRYIALRIEFSDVWNHTASRSAMQRQFLVLESIQLEQKMAEEALKTELANINVAIRGSIMTLQAAQAQVRAEQQKFKAEMDRYREGRSNTATVTQFEGDLKASELRLMIQKMSLEQTKYQLALAMGISLLHIEAPEAAALTEGL